MKISASTLLSPECDCSPRNTLLAFDPTFLRPIRQDSNQSEGGGNRETFKVFCFSCFVFWDNSNGGVKASETRQAAANERSERNGIQICSESDNERY